MMIKLTTTVLLSLLATLITTIIDSTESLTHQNQLGNKWPIDYLKLRGYLPVLDDQYSPELANDKWKKEGNSHYGSRECGILKENSRRAANKKINYKSPYGRENIQRYTEENSHNHHKRTVNSFLDNIKQKVKVFLSGQPTYPFKYKFEKKYKSNSNKCGSLKNAMLNKLRPSSPPVLNIRNSMSRAKTKAMLLKNRDPFYNIPREFKTNHHYQPNEQYEEFNNPWEEDAKLHNSKNHKDELHKFNEIAHNNKKKHKTWNLLGKNNLNYFNNNEGRLGNHANQANFDKERILSYFNRKFATADDLDGNKSQNMDIALDSNNALNNLAIPPLYSENTVGMASRGNVKADDEIIAHYFDQKYNADGKNSDYPLLANKLRLKGELLNQNTRINANKYSPQF